MTRSSRVRTLLRHPVAFATLIVGTVCIFVLLYLVSRSLRMLLVRNELRSAQERTAVLCMLGEVLTPPLRKQKIDWLLNGWGEEGQFFDLAIMHLLEESHKPGVWQLDDDLFQAIAARLVQDRRLRKQVYWHYRWLVASHHPQVAPSPARPSRSLSEHEVENLSLRACHKRLASRDLSHWEKRYYVLIIACLLDQPHLLQMDGVHLDEHWRVVMRWFATKAPFFVYDAEAGFFVLDETASTSGVAVDPRRQLWDVPDKPLPGWED